MADIRAEWLALGRSLATPADHPADDRFWAPQLECLPRAELRRLQAKRASLAYRYLWEKSPFYRAKFEASNLGPDAVRTLDDLLAVPVTHRDEWATNQGAHAPWGNFSPLSDERWLESGWMVFSTSGTTGDSPRLFRQTTFDRDMWAWQGARALYAMGVRRGDLALNCFGGMSVAFWGLHHALTLMGVPVIPGVGVPTERRIASIRNLRPTVLLCTPSYALHLGRTAQEMGFDPASSTVRTIVAAGEHGACVPATKSRIEALWGAKVHDDFGCTEVAMSPLGYTCAYQADRSDGVDPHLMEDVYYVEALDPTTWTPVAPGKQGVIVVSNLFSEAQPILRFVMGDWVCLSEEPCPCGRTHARAVGGLLGRSDHAIKIRGLMVQASAIEEGIRALPGVGDEFCIDVTRDGDLDQMKVTLELAPATTTAPPTSSQLAARLRGALGITVEVVLVPHRTLPRTEGKAKRLIDHRGK